MKYSLTFDEIIKRRNADPEVEFAVVWFDDVHYVVEPDPTWIFEPDPTWIYPTCIAVFTLGVDEVVTIESDNSSTTVGNKSLESMHICSPSFNTLEEAREYEAEMYPYGYAGLCRFNGIV